MQDTEKRVITEAERSVDQAMLLLRDKPSVSRLVEAYSHTHAQYTRAYTKPHAHTGRQEPQNSIGIVKRKKYGSLEIG